MARNKVSDPDRDEQCYNLRARGLSYNQIADRMGLNSAVHVMQCVKRWAKEHGLRPDPKPIEQEPGERYYEDRKTGMLWREIGEKYGILTNSAYGCALAYAERYSLPWPVGEDGRESLETDI